jgi:hypothetical protein
MSYAPTKVCARQPHRMVSRPFLHKTRHVHLGLNSLNALLCRTRPANVSVLRRVSFAASIDAEKCRIMMYRSRWLVYFQRRTTRKLYIYNVLKLHRLLCHRNLYVESRFGETRHYAARAHILVVSGALCPLQVPFDFLPPLLPINHFSLRPRLLRRKHNSMTSECLF